MMHLATISSTQCK